MFYSNYKKKIFFEKKIFFSSIRLFLVLWENENRKYVIKNLFFIFNFEL